MADEENMLTSDNGRFIYATGKVKLCYLTIYLLYSLFAPSLKCLKHVKLVCQTQLEMICFDRDGYSRVICKLIIYLSSRRVLIGQEWEERRVNIVKNNKKVMDFRPRS